MATTSPPATKHALVVGALGVTGRTLVAHLSTLPDWTVVGLSRRTPDYESPARHLAVDLLDLASCERQLAELPDTTHIFYAAYQDKPSMAEQVGPNLAMLVNAVESVEAVAPQLQRVVLVQGGKVYGVHLGPYKTPALETDARHLPPNFYYDQEDYLRRRQADAPWEWAAVRPSAICGFAVGNLMNLLAVIAVYAAICKELGLPLRFPGTPGAYQALFEVTDADLLARAMAWAATDERAANEAFNITNGDFFRWKYLWPKFAAFFGMAYAEPQTLPLAEFMGDKEPLWNAMVAKYGLQPYRFQDLVSWGFGDSSFRLDYDLMSDTGKARRAGFGAAVQSEAMFLRLFAQLRQDKIIP